MMNSRLLQFLLLVVILLSGYFAWQKMPRLGTLPASENQAILNRQPSQSAADDQGLDLSGGEQHPFRRPQRDLFASLFPAPPPPKPVAVVQPPRPLQVPVPVKIEPPPLPPPPKVVRAQALMPRFKVLGSLRKNGEMTAFIGAAGGIYLLKQNQVFASEYRVDALNERAITIVRDGDGARVQLALQNELDSKPMGADFGQPGPPRREPVPYIPPPPEPEAPAEAVQQTPESQPFIRTPAPRSFPFQLPTNKNEGLPQ